MMDILIKSFNRPFYLDRCLQSIDKFVEGNFNIKILDDGTPEKYLHKIKTKFPFVEIITSENYSQKTIAIDDNLKTGKKIDGFQIPTKLWRDSAANSSDYFIMTEDDVWFTNKINVDEAVNHCINKDISLLKLGWLGNFNDDKNIRIKELNSEINATVPKKLFLMSAPVMNLFFYNRYKFFTVLYRIGLVDNTTKRKYWALNSILMGLWKKDYWLYVWKDAAGKVDEKQQLRNAAVYYRKNKKNENFVARLQNEVMKTTFQSSATNSYHEYGFNFDVNYFNHLINEAWYNDQFDSMQNFPKDFSLDYFEEFLSEKIDKNEFRKWVKQFKKQYEKLGCETE